MAASSPSSDLDSGSVSTDRRTLSRHPIGLVCRRTGLKPDLIRAWEARYGAVKPGRSASRRRLYSDDDIERLKLLSQAVNAGRGIRHVAQLSREELVEMIAEDAVDLGPTSIAQPPPMASSVPTNPEELSQTIAAYLKDCLHAVEALDGQRLAHLLGQASIEVGRIALLEQVIMPLMRQIGERWHEGSLRPIHEHLASAEVRSFLGSLPVRDPSPQAPCLVATTPAGQSHEIGALLAARAAAECGWKTTYLGPDLPAEEIAAAARQAGARVVALGLTFPTSDPQTCSELRRLHDLLEGVHIVAGGQAAASYGETLQEIGARRVSSLKELRRYLTSL